MVDRHRSPQNRRPHRAMTLIALVAALSACNEPAEESAPALEASAKGYNLLLITVDTLRADRLNSYGYGERITSPNIDRLAERSVLFESASAPRSLTWPSLASVLTGQYPKAHGIVQNGYSFDDGQPTLPISMREAGYETAAFLSNMCKANHSGWDTRQCTGGVDGKIHGLVDQWLGERDAERPFFLWTHWFGAHGPYYNGGDRAAQWIPDYEGPVAPKKGRLNRIMTDQIPLEEDDVAYLDALYDAAVAGTDNHMARLLDRLEQAGALERTVIVFLADHGEDLWDHNGYLYHACSPYESGLHVPLMVHLPDGISGGTRVSETVELIDVLPTLAALFDLPWDECIDGRSLLPTIDRGDGLAEDRHRPALSEYGSERIETVRQGRWKLVLNPDRHQPLCLPGAPADLYPIGEIELYDLATDPGELDSLAQQEEARVTALRDLGRRRRSAACDPRGTASQEIPDELRRELENKGYVVN